MTTSTPPRFVTRLVTWLSSTYARVVFGMLLIGVGYVLLFSYFGTNSSERMYGIRRDEIKRLAYLGVNVIQPVLDRQNQGEITPAQALEEGRELIRRMRYMYGMGANYLFMSSYDGRMLVQPFEPDKEGTNQIDLVDANGRYIIRELISTAQSPAGEGFVEYLYPAPGQNRPQLKISYVIGIPEWGAYIGTGMYVGDLEDQRQAFDRNALLLTGGLFAVIFVAVLLVLRPVFSSYRTLLGVFDQIRRNPDAAPSVPAERYPPGSEGRQLLSGFRDMLRQVQFSKQQ